MMMLMTSKTIKSSTVLPMMMMMVSNNRGINIQNNKLMHLMLMKALMGDKKALKVPKLEATCDLNGASCKMEWKMSLS